MYCIIVISKSFFTNKFQIHVLLYDIIIRSQADHFMYTDLQTTNQFMGTLQNFASKDDMALF